MAKRKVYLNTEPNKRLFGYRITDEIYEMLEELAELLGKNRNEILDSAIIDYYDKIKKYRMWGWNDKKIDIRIDIQGC